MTFSPQLEARFDKLLKSYPPGRQRSALIPMLLYAQDEVGVGHRRTDRGGRAQRVGVHAAAGQRGASSYYSMLHRKPLGKYHVQICTNISCLLHGGDKLWEHACKKLGIGHKEVTADGAVFARRSGVHRRLLLGPGHPGELRLPPLRHAREARPASRRPEEEAISNALQRTQSARNQGADAPLRPAEFGVASTRISPPTATRPS